MPLIRGLVRLGTTAYFGGRPKGLRQGCCFSRVGSRLFRQRPFPQACPRASYLLVACAGLVKTLRGEPPLVMVD